MELHSYRGFYALMYRHNSGFQHASAHGLVTVAVDLPNGRTRVALEAGSDLDPLALVAALYTYSLHIASERLGWPKPGDIHAAWNP